MTPTTTPPFDTPIVIGQEYLDNTDPDTPVKTPHLSTGEDPGRLSPGRLQWVMEKYRTWLMLHALNGFDQTKFPYVRETFSILFSTGLLHRTTAAAEKLWPTHRNFRVYFANPPNTRHPLEGVHVPRTVIKGQSPSDTTDTLLDVWMPDHIVLGILEHALQEYRANNMYSDIALTLETDGTAQGKTT